MFRAWGESEVDIFLVIFRFFILFFFKLSSLQDFLRRHGFTDYTRGQITERLKELNNGANSDKEYRFKDSRDKWRKVRVWFIPEMKRGEVELPDVEINEDTPF